MTNVSDDGLVSLDGFIGKPMLVMFICNHCPYVIHLIKPLCKLANEAQINGFGVVAISSNDVNAYPQDGPKAMREFALNYGFEFPYLFDETQEVAKNYGAACTPDFFVFDRQHMLRYRGQMDASRPSNSLPVTGHDLQSALEAIAGKQTVNQEQIASIGCSIKWRPGNEPEYFNIY